MSKRKKVVKFRRRRSINIGIVIFYNVHLRCHICIHILTKDHLSIYEVKEGSVVEDNLVTGLILRDEEVFYSDQAGYVSYFQKEELGC